MKASKASVAFEHPAQGPHHCSQCRHYQAATDRCEIVAGVIQPGDWCKQFSAKGGEARQEAYDAHLNSVARPTSR